MRLAERELDGGCAAGSSPKVRGLPVLFVLVLSTGILKALPATAICLSKNALHFAVLRNDREIGHHTIQFQRSGDELQVRIKTRIAVTFGFLTLFRFEHDGFEVWRNGKIHVMRTRTHDDGEDHSIDAWIDKNGTVEIVANGRRMTSQKVILPVSLWNVDSVREESLSNLSGSPLNIRVQERSAETGDIQGRNVPSTRLSITGEFRRDVWYEDRCELVKIAFVGRDGSRIEYVRR